MNNETRLKLDQAKQDVQIARAYCEWKINRECDAWQNRYKNNLIDHRRLDQEQLKAITRLRYECETSIIDRLALIRKHGGKVA
jgi:hypothetical protein